MGEKSKGNVNKKKPATKSLKEKRADANIQQLMYGKGKEEDEKLTQSEEFKKWKEKEEGKISLPDDWITLWQGIINATGLLPIAVPTALEALALPIFSAMVP